MCIRDRYPGAKLFGSSRHAEKLPDLPWQKALLDDPKTFAEFDEDVDLRIPAGVDFISSNESVHFSSVVAYHPATKTIHVRSHYVLCFAKRLLRLHRICPYLYPAVQLHPILPVRRSPLLWHA